MVRSPRLFISGGIYHVYCRVARSEQVFADHEEAQGFVDTVNDVKRLHGFSVLAFCLMSTHYHIVIQSREIPLWRSMARIQCRVARSFNRRHRFLGRLWQSRYKARLVRNQQYFEQLLAYVHLNPVAAGLVKDPSDYRWCDHPAFLGRNPPLLCDVGLALRGFGETLGDARTAYLARVRAVAEERWLREGVRDLPWWAEVANDELLADLESHFGAEDFAGKPLEHEIPDRPALEKIAQSVCQGSPFRLKDLKGRSRTRDLAAVRKGFVLSAVEEHGHAVRDVAAFLEKHPGSVSRWLETTPEISALGRNTKEP